METTLNGMAEKYNKVRRANASLRHGCEEMRRALRKTEDYIRDVSIQEEQEFEDLKTILHLMATVGAPVSHFGPQGNIKESWERAGFRVELIEETPNEYIVWVHTPWWHKAGTGRFRYPAPVGRVKLEQWSTYFAGGSAAYVPQHDAARSYATAVMSIAAVSKKLMEQFGIEPDPNLRENITIEPCYRRHDAGGQDFFIMKEVNVRYLGSPVGTYRLPDDMVKSVNGGWGVKGTLCFPAGTDRCIIDALLLKAKRALDRHHDAILDDLLANIERMTPFYVEEGLYDGSR